MAEARVGQPRHQAQIISKIRISFPLFFMPIFVGRLRKFSSIPMSDWQQVQSLFLLSADLPVEERDQVLEKLCGGDIELRGEVESLLIADSDSEATIDAAIQDVASTVLDTPMLLSERLGVYRIVREIGRGGMGSVYLALRDDDEYTREVALKVVKRGMDTEEVLRRFREERQILANLDHPFIARLFDGGTTAEGICYFAMELVEGCPVDVFCREHALDVKARCRLFLHILEAVSYAHRNLVVHGDLKPANIFITLEGTPKLLDFGVAKLVGRDDDDEVSRIFTPGYASPEQVRGTPVTTAADVYSLGAVFYELLSGKRSQPLDFDTPTEIERAICDLQAPRPSLVAKAIPADLDCVVQMALQKEPEHRYQSAEQFAEDVRRYLENRPIAARPDTTGYRARKFLVRNRVQVAMASIVAIALIGGLAVSLAQTRRARAERTMADIQRKVALDERAEAEAARVSEAKQRVLADEQRGMAEKERDEAKHQKAIADQRLKDIMELAGRTLFDAHSAIASLPGSIPARKKIVETTLSYLESMAGHIGENDEMREALTEAYYKVWLIQGDPHGASLQDNAGAEESLHKAEAILLPAYHRHPNDPGLMLRWLEIQSGLADLVYRSGKLREGVRIYLDLLPVTRRLARTCNALPCETQEPAIETALTNFLSSIDPQQALKHADHGIELGRKLMARHPGNAEIEQAQGVLLGVAASAYKGLGNLEKSGEHYRQSIEIREQLLLSDPANVSIRRNLLIVYGNYVLLLGVPWSQNLDRPAEARVYAQKAIAIARETVRADPQDATARRDLGVILGRLGMIDPEPGAAAASLASLEEAGDLIAPIVGANPKSYEAASQLALIQQYQARRLAELGRFSEAAQTYRKAMGLLEPFFMQSKITMAPEYIYDQDGLALLYASTGNSASALDMAKKAISSGETYAAISPPNDNRLAALAGAWSALALVQSKAGLTSEAHQSAERAMTMWGTIQQHGILTAYRKPMTDARAILSTAP